MSPALPVGDPAPEDGALPASAAVGAHERALAFYLHVPFCRVRCGYCDFTTYTAEELGGAGSGSSRAGYAAVAEREVRMSAEVLAGAGAPARQVSTVFIGGGTPTLLPSGDLLRLVDAVRDVHGLAPGAEVTTEANPDSVTPASLAELAAGGVTRVSFGMQSAVPHVLATLDRTHDPARVPDVVRWAREAGLQVSLDLIYGTPGESRDDWRASLDAALACAPDHVSAYALVVEAGTRMAGQVRRGELALPDSDDLAAKYEDAGAALSAAGMEWYEVSNWAARPDARCRHNLSYWRADDWWGVGPGAHSHVGGVRWWNVKHPGAYSARLERGASPAHGREVLDDEARLVERVLLGVRLREGLPVGALPAEGRAELVGVVADGLVEPGPAGCAPERVVLTDRGRLLADGVVRRLLGW
ncbi:radical SAM family heme chaperone HemW [uncultured Pseudokineococcus sp.]|uniref:radical SAM family heme chaperone HemW n=1 Tax=uncultured Pseudokineococcus sp. TaxID=1642928 RepID=UPI00262741BA|nr:radical SAM family heme chaperone HemW [uncultured Pseudokineococcus sp.]